MPDRQRDRPDSHCTLKQSVLNCPSSVCIDTWRKFKEEEDKQKDFSKIRSCEDGIKEVVKYLNPEQLDSLCTS